jgi:hypothetical protein
MPAQLDDQFVVLAYFDNSDPDVWGPYPSRADALDALKALAPRYDGDDSLTEITIHKLMSL